MTGIELYYTHNVDGHLRKIQINDNNLKRIIVENVGLDLSKFSLEKVVTLQEIEN